MPEHRPAFAVRCGRCECDMEEQNFRVVGIAHEKEGSCTRIESSVWVCPSCGRREGRAEVWTPTDCGGCEAVAETPTFRRVMPERYTYPRAYQRKGHSRRNGT